MKKTLFKTVFLVILSFLVSIPVFTQEHPLGDLGIPNDYYDTINYDLGLGLKSLDLPFAYNWKEKDMVTDAKLQGCGSCWAFAAVGAFESKLMIAGYGEYDLSEQQQLSCNTSMLGCAGGYMTCLKYWYNHGPKLESCTGFRPVDNNCAEFNHCTELPFKTYNYYTVDTSSIDAIKESLYHDGPSYFRFNVYSDFDIFWKNSKQGEVYRHRSGYWRGGHAVLIIGWDDNKEAWLCKNSWGKTGGPNGDGTFWIHYNDHYMNLGFGMANIKIKGKKAAPPENLVSFWTFDNLIFDYTDITFLDEKKRNYAEIVNGNETGLVQGKVGSAYYFDGTAYMRIADDSSLNFGKNDLSICAWIKTAQNKATILDKRGSGGGYHLVVYSSRLLFNFNDKSGRWLNFWNPNSINIADNQWHLIAVTVDRNNPQGGKLYVDGVSIHTFNPTSIADNTTNSADLLIGKHKDNFWPYIGYMDEIFITSCALSYAEISGIYSAGSNGISTVNINTGLQLAGEWEFENGDAYDISGNGVHGSSVGSVQIVNDYALFDGSASYIEIPYTGGYASRLNPPLRGFKKLSIEMRVYMENPSQYYNVFFSHPSYTMAGHSLYSSHARSTWVFSGVRSILGQGGGRWGSGPNLWGNRDIDTPAYYCGWELSRPLFNKKGTWMVLKTVYDYDVNLVYQYLDGVLLNSISLMNNGPVTKSTSTYSAFIGKYYPWSSWYYKGKIDYVKILAEKN